MGKRLLAAGALHCFHLVFYGGMMCVCLGLYGMVLTTETQKYLTNKLKSTEKLSISIHQHGIKLKKYS